MADANIRIIITAVDNASAELAKVKSALGGMSNASGDATKNTESLKKQFGGLKDQFGGIVSTIASVTAAVYAMKKVWDFAKEGASLMAVEETSGKLAVSMNSNLGTIVSSIQEASLGTISYYDAVQSASNAMMLGLGADADKLGNLMQIAALRGRAMGMTTTQAFSDMVRGIGRLSPMILDNLGIVIDAENRYKVHADAIGKTASELTSAEKRQALLNGVLEEGNKLLAEAGGLTATYATGMERATAALEDVWQRGKTKVGGLFGAFFLSKEELSAAYSEQKAYLWKTAKTYEEYVQGVREIGLTTGVDVDLFGEKRLKELTDKNARRAFYQAQYTRARMADDAKATGEVIDSTSELNDTFNEYILKIGLAGDLTEMQSDYLEDLAKGGDVATAAMSNLSKSTAKWVRETAAAFGGFSATQELDIAFAFGEIDTTSYAAALAIQKYVESMQAAGASMPEMIRGLQAIKGNLDGLLVGGSATYTIDYVISVLFQGMNVPFNLAANLLGLSASQAASALSWTLKAKASGANVGGTVFGNISQKALGGAVRTGEPYLIGELGPELFVPQDNGTIIPNNKMANVGGKNVTIHVTYAPTISTASESELEWALKPMIQRALREA